MYFYSKRKKRAKKKLKQGPVNLVKYHQFPFLYEDLEDEENLDLDQESSYFSGLSAKQKIPAMTSHSFALQTNKYLKNRLNPVRIYR